MSFTKLKDGLGNVISPGIVFVFMSLSIPSETYEGRHNIFVFMSLSIPSETYEGRHNINKM